MVVRKHKFNICGFGGGTTWILNDWGFLQQDSISVRDVSYLLDAQSLH
jgi:hypothetical protein